MVNLQNPLLYAKLYEETQTPLRSKLFTNTRQTSVFAILKSHVGLSDFVCTLYDVELDNVLLLAYFEQRIDSLLAKLKELNDVVLQLQLHQRKIRQAREYFYAVLDVFTNVEARLNQSTQIVHGPVFESSFVKIQDAREQDHTTTAKRAVRGVLVEQSAASETDPASDGIALRALKRLNAFVTTAESECQDTH